MRWEDRLFAFRRLPAGGDVVQVLLWIVGWAVVAGFLMLVAFAVWGFRVLLDLGGVSGDSRGFAITAVAVSAASTLVWFGLACWSVSEAYGGWRAGHPHGKGWTLVIAALLLMNGAAPLVMRFEVGTVQRVASSLTAAFGIALLVAVFTTKPPQREPAAP